MRGMILAAGLGTRLRPLTYRTPKPLVRVGGRPMIEYALALLAEAEIREVVVNLHHLGDQIRRELGDGSAFGLSISYSHEEPLLDTGGGIKKVERFLGGDTFVVVNSDTVIDLRLADVLAQHRETRALATMVLRPDRRAAHFGLIEIDATRRIRRFRGQPAGVAGPLTPLMFAGVHVFEPAVFSFMGEGRFGINAETYPAMLAAGAPLFGFVCDGYWRVLDTHAGLAEGRFELADGRPLAPRRRPDALRLQPVASTSTLTQRIPEP